MSSAKVPFSSRIDSDLYTRLEELYKTENGSIPTKQQLSDWMVNRALTPIAAAAPVISPDTTNTIDIQQLQADYETEKNNHTSLRTSFDEYRGETEMKLRGKTLLNTSEIQPVVDAQQRRMQNQLPQSSTLEKFIKYIYSVLKEAADKDELL